MTRRERNPFSYVPSSFVKACYGVLDVLLRSDKARCGRTRNNTPKLAEEAPEATRQDPERVSTTIRPRDIQLKIRFSLDMDFREYGLIMYIVF